MDSETAKILYDDWQNKKVFNANWHFDCAKGGCEVEEGEEFYFFGDKQKICKDCFVGILNELEAIAEGLG